MLSPQAIAIYLQSAAKIFGVWAINIAERWDEDELPDVKRVVEIIITAVQSFVGSEDIEVQESVGLATELFQSCSADLRKHDRQQIFFNYSPLFNLISRHINHNRNLIIHS